MKKETLLKIKSKDKLVHDVISKFDERSAEGYSKYGVTLREHNDTLYRWLNDIQEELMDAILYLQKAKEESRELVEEMYLQEAGNDLEGFPDYCNKIGHPRCSTLECPCAEGEIESHPISSFPGYTGTITKASGDVTINWNRSQ